MHAYTLTSYGPDGLAPADIAEPAVDHGQVKVRIDEIAINPLDWKLRNGDLTQLIPLALPTVIGTDFAGTVIEVGDGVDDLEIGDRVAGFADSGAFAEVGVTRRERVIKVPAGLDLRSAAAAATAGETAQRILALIELKPESTVVVNGAAGAVGSAVTQLLVASGHRVIGTASPGNHAYVRGLGAEPVNHDDTLVAELQDAAPDGVDAAIDTAGHDFISRVSELIPAGRIVTIVDFAAGSRGAIVTAVDPTQITAGTVGGVLEQAARGEFTVGIDSTFAFSELPQALAKSETGHVRGKIVVTMSG